MSPKNLTSNRRRQSGHKKKLHLEILYEFTLNNLLDYVLSNEALRKRNEIESFLITRDRKRIIFDNYIQLKKMYSIICGEAQIDSKQDHAACLMGFERSRALRVAVAWQSNRFNFFLTVHKTTTSC